MSEQEPIIYRASIKKNVRIKDPESLAFAQAAFINHDLSLAILFAEMAAGFHDPNTDEEELTSPLARLGHKS